MTPHPSSNSESDRRMDDPLHDVSRFDAGAEHDPAYKTALEHLYGRLDTEALDPANFNTVDRDIDVYRNFLHRLGNPHMVSKVVHITGTRGKGSVVATLESILGAAGVKTGATISPHLVEVRERIRIAGEDLTRAQFAELHQRLLKPAMEAENYQQSYRTVFELLTALAFLAFREEQVELAVVEVGLGGKLDATNVVQPSLSILTRIGLDHTKVLGNTVAEIAADKSHIIKPGAPAIIAPQQPQALEVIKRRAAQTGSELWTFERELKLDLRSISAEGTTFDFTTPHRIHSDLQTGLLGAHMAENAAVAVAAADRLDADCIVSIPEEAIRKGLAETRWPGRGEILQHNPLMIIDGAHSPLGAKVLGEMVRTCWPEKKVFLLLGVNRDKDLDGFLDDLGITPEFTMATAADTPRALLPNELADQLKRRGWLCEAAPLPTAHDRLLERAKQENGLALATGSLYLVGGLHRLRLTRGF